MNQEQKLITAGEPHPSLYGKGGKHYPEGMRPRICPVCNEEYFFYCDCKNNNRDLRIIENEFTYLPIRHCNACGKDWIMKDEKDVVCPDKIKIIKDCLSSTVAEFRKMCAEYFGREPE